MSVTIKTDFQGDLRRLTVPTTISFADLIQKIKSLYSLDYVKIFYLDEEHDKVIISSDLELNLALQGVKGSFKILVEMGTAEDQEIPSIQVTSQEIKPLLPKQETSEPVLSSPISISPNPSPSCPVISNPQTAQLPSMKCSPITPKNEIPEMPQTPPIAPEKEIPKHEPNLSHPSIFVESNTLLQQPDFQNRVRSLVQETLLSAPVMQVLMEQLTPKLYLLIQETLTKQRSDPVISPPKIVEEKPKPKPQINPATPITYKQPSLIDSIIRDTEEVLSYPKKVLDTVIGSGKEDSPDKPLIQGNPQTNQPLQNPPQQKIQPSPQAQSVQPPQQTNQTPMNFFSSIIQGFVPSPTINPAQTQQPDNQEVSEELLQKLASMGFTDREQNIKVAKFHRKYNEGLDEILDDLLTQSQIEANKK